MGALCEGEEKGREGTDKKTQLTPKRPILHCPGPPRQLNQDRDTSVVQDGNKPRQ
jgi:hypothetical protein